MLTGRALTGFQKRLKKYQPKGKISLGRPLK
jgi:hypothetical protein